MNIILNNVYYKQNNEILEYKDIYLDTSVGVLKVFAACLDFENDAEIESMYKLKEMDSLRDKYGNLTIDEVRRTYDSNMYLLISGKFLFAIEYVLNSNFKHSVQEFRIIEEIHELNKTEFEDFKELDIVELPILPS